MGSDSSGRRAPRRFLVGLQDRQPRHHRGGDALADLHRLQVHRRQPLFHLAHPRGWNKIRSGDSGPSGNSRASSALSSARLLAGLGQHAVGEAVKGGMGQGGRQHRLAAAPSSSAWRLRSRASGASAFGRGFFAAACRFLGVIAHAAAWKWRISDSKISLRQIAHPAGIEPAVQMIALHAAPPGHESRAPPARSARRPGRSPR